MTTAVRARLRVTGTVQGVGFRPFVYRQALELGLRGFVCNDHAGVLVEVEGAAPAVDELARRLREQAPPLARVAGVEREQLAALGGDTAFAIVASTEGGHPDVPVSVDCATCDDCLAELRDPADRRHRYAFINCTNCGPRYSIVLAVPYDRPATTMAAFEMCADCRAEYDDPADRRFHAQPNACPRCGPRLWWRPSASTGATAHERATAPGSRDCPPIADTSGAGLAGTDSPTGEVALELALAALREGRVVAVKGIGGYHLAVDATDGRAVAELRRRKARDDKPFAVMVPDLATAHRLCRLSPAAEAALVSPRRPIVLAPRRPGSGVAGTVAPGLPELGLMLAYSPLHHLLLDGVGRPLVMTSGNLNDEPIAHEDEDALSRLASLADGFLGHDRPIHIRCDDSVARAVEPGRPARASEHAADAGSAGNAGDHLQLLRRSRGYAPEPLRLPQGRPRVGPPADERAGTGAGRPVLAVGAELKNTISVARDGFVVARHHIGDLEHLATYRSFLQALGHLGRLYGVTPEVVAHDLHPEYLSTKWALDQDVPTVGVQHHHAHVASCLVEHGRCGPVLGLAFDGLGYGNDGTLWGGEFLVADLDGCERAGHLWPVVLPGGGAAIREPWGMALAWLMAAGVDEPLRHLPIDPHAARSRPGGSGTTPSTDARSPTSGSAAGAAVAGLVAAGRGPTTTSMGRLFDAVAVLAGCRPRVTYEAQAAIELEALARTVPRSAAPAYAGTVVVERRDEMAVLDARPLVGALVADLTRGAAAALVAAGFHEAVGRAAADLAARLATERGLATAVLTGGVFQNARLAEIVEEALVARGVEVLVHREVPPNDGGISIGQAAIASSARG
jgi:hydrogenase maturation protein HypF